MTLGASILRLLRDSPLQPGALAERLSVDREQIQQAVLKLRDSGMDLPLHPLLGYLLQSAPEKLVVDDLLSRRGTEWLGEIWTLESTGSTNTVAMEQGMLGLPGPLAIFAEHQTAGRGRFGRRWESKSGEGLSFSLLLRPSVPQEYWSRLPTLAALAVARCASEFLPREDVQIKWPNDVVVRGRKLSGLLAETGSDPVRGPFLVVGIGLNVNQSGFPAPLDETATSLCLMTGRAYDRAHVAARLLGHLNELLPLLGNAFPKAIEEAKARSSVLGKRLLLHTGIRALEGIAESLDAEGRLQVRMQDGTLENFSAGEISLKPW